ncbi:hypothetical protein K7432_007222 [Basidiobolus ranarum]|uniref:Bromodomain-containing protein n=1 Tax=Basidiobolus ranarum TaxID=34480 RepID=A0ABR2W0E9_9FUNG
MISMANSLELKAYPVEEMSLESGPEVKTFTEFPKTNSVELNVGRSSPITPTDMVSEVLQSNETNSDSGSLEKDKSIKETESEILDEHMDLVEVSHTDKNNSPENDLSEVDIHMSDVVSGPSITIDDNSLVETSEFKPSTESEQVPLSPTKSDSISKSSTDAITTELNPQTQDIVDTTLESNCVPEPQLDEPTKTDKLHSSESEKQVPDVAPTMEPKEEPVATSVSSALTSTPPFSDSRSHKRPSYDDPSLKRSHKMSRLSEIEHAKALVGTFASTAVSPPRRPNITREQLKYCSAILKALKRHRDAGPFLKPVDHVKMQIPDYPKIVKNPMDLSTIEKKLNNNQYITVDDFVTDVRQVFENCYLYNGRESIVSTFAQNLEKVFNNQLRKMPQATPKIVESTKDESYSEGRPRSRPRSNSRRSSIGSKGRRESQSSITSTKRGSLKNPLHDVHYKFCMSVIKEFFKKTHSHYAYPFLEPVDWKSLDIPDYLSIIKHPMDASTIKRNLESGLYSTTEEFEADVRLMFRNCYKYNPPKTPVYTMGQTLENIFNAKWAQKPSLPPPKEPTPEPEPEEFSEQESSDEEDDKHAQQIAELERHLEFMSKQLASMKGAAREKKKKEKVKTPVKTKTQASKAPKVTKTPKSSKTKTTPKSRSRKPSAHEYSTDDEKYPEITFEQKRELSDSINLLPGEKLNTVVSIIHSSMPHLKDTSGQEEIELDIDSLDHRTLYKLYKFVRTNVAPKRAKPARKNSRPHFSEEEQARKIHELEENLRKFESAESHSSAKADLMDDDNSGSSSSSSGSSSSGSDSDTGSESN